MKKLINNHQLMSIKFKHLKSKINMNFFDYVNKILVETTRIIILNFIKLSLLKKFYQRQSI
jgi:hypothetical protein